MEAAVCAALLQHARPNKPATMDDLLEHTGQRHSMVRPAIIALVQRGTVVRIKGGYHMAPQIVLGVSVAAPREVNVMQAGIYNGAELRPFTGRVGAMDAFALPSRGMQV